ncbi:MAG: transposase [Burkholderiaceae bacterium]
MEKRFLETGQPLTSSRVAGMLHASGAMFPGRRTVADSAAASPESTAAGLMIFSGAAMGQDWVHEELAGTDLGDARLNKRSATLRNQLADMPNASIAQACSGWADIEAAYGLLAREEIGWEAIVAPCFSFIE